MARQVITTLAGILLMFHKSLAIRHIVFIVADDLGWNDVGFHNPSMITPNIDKLASQGMILNSSYVQPVCTPSRHSFMTGVYPFKVGLQRLVILPFWPQCSPLNLDFLPAKLKKLGYSTHAIGKWHLGFCNWKCTPTYRGFDTFLGFYNGKEDYYTKDLLNGTDFRNGTERTYSDVYSAELFSSRAVDIIKQHDKETPLFLYLPYQSVHSPVQVPKQYEDMYPNINNDQRRQYCGMVSALDEGIGNITNALERYSMLNDTLIIFTTDNGGIPNEGGNNFPLRGAKTTLYEGGTRAAAFVYGSGLEKTGHTYDGIMHAVDWNPTILAAAGGTPSSGIDGIDQWDVLRTATESKRKEFVYNLDNAIDAPTGHAAIRVGDFKLIDGYAGKYPGWYKPPEIYEGVNLKFKPQIPITKHNGMLENIVSEGECGVSRELYNLRDDPYEHDNVAMKYPDVVKQLLDKLDGYRKSYVAPQNMTNDPKSNPNNFGGYWSPGWC